MDDIEKKNIALKPYVYERLVDRKHGKDTFSDVIERMLDATEKKKK